MISIRPLHQADQADWRRMRLALWPECPPHRHEDEMRTIVADAANQCVFVAENDAGRLCGFVEGSIHPHALGCDTNPVGYVEGWWVDETCRRSGVGRALLHAVENWARQRGCREMASDCYSHNQISFNAHLAIGYHESGRLIHFAKKLNG